jgi:hypothetical protein
MSPSGTDLADITSKECHFVKTTKEANMKGTRILKVLMAVTLCLSGTAYAERTIWYVHPDSVLNSIQTALDSCADNDIVLVGPGTYVENIAWPNTQGIHLTSELGPEVTIIDGSNPTNSDSASVIAFVTGQDTTSMVHGFTIRNGSGTYGGGLWSLGCGIYCSNSNPTIAMNFITGNETSGGHGGGIYCFNADPIIIKNEIRENEVGYYWGGNGGGICCIESSPMIMGNIITDNMAEDVGGGIYCGTNSSPVIDSCIITDNGEHSGVDCDSGSAPTIHHCSITDNAEYALRNWDGNIIIDAEYNWWGDASGPYHPIANPGGLGDSVSDYVDFDPWLSWPVGVEERPIIKPVEIHETLTATIFSGPLRLPEGKKCKVFDITGRVVEPSKITRGIYFIEVDGVVTQKVIKVR